MDRSKLLHVTKRSEWRRWLQRNHGTEKEVWLVFNRASSGKPRISYNDAVEEALCFGWIDSTARKVDEERFAQRFTPRRPNSPYSQVNLERLRDLVARGKVKPEVRASLPDLSVKRLRLAPDVREAIEASPDARRNFRRFPARYKRIRIGFIEGARGRPAEFRKRLAYLVKMTERNKQFGFGGSERYFRGP